ncbi:MAG: glycosyltransferase family 9 protein [Verrucomicrobiota bacterium]
MRNNDIGDLLIITPIFEALKRGFPPARLYAGIGRWNLSVLANNPYVDEVLEINAPWHNKFICQVPPRSLRGLIRSFAYIWRSRETRQLKELDCSIGIDILGSPEGSLLMMRAGIPWRLGVDGYAGGNSACQQNVTYDAEMNVGRAALKFAELLGATIIPEPRPQLFLTDPEKDQALETWRALGQPGTTTGKRIIIAPGGGIVEKCWPRENYRKLTAWLGAKPDVKIFIVGSQSERELGEYVRTNLAAATNLCGKTSLRQTFGLIWASQGVVCNSSMVLHTAAAFNKPTIALLGTSFASARKHRSLWGYGTGDLHLGREPERDRIYTAEEAIPIVESHLQLRLPRKTVLL